MENRFHSTIVVAPRERFSSITASLKSLFKTIDPLQPVIVVEGATPEDIRSELAQMQTARQFEHVALDYPIVPQAARNIGAKMAKTDYIVFADNDLEYAPGWLNAMEATAKAENADVVAPLIFIGPNDPAVIHHGGGWLAPKWTSNGILMKEKHRLMDAKWPEVQHEVAKHAPVENEVCEFHCLMARRSYIENVGWLDERLVTREQIDFALQAKFTGARVVFSKDAHVTYRALDPITRLDDLHYFLFRWSDQLVVQSLDAFEESWDITSERDRVRFKWTRGHRARAVASLCAPTRASVIGRKRAGHLFLGREERRARARFEQQLKAAPAPTCGKKACGPAAQLFEGAAQQAAE